MTQRLYKILVNGKSCNGGKMKWSLPTQDGDDWLPGEWASVKGDLQMCRCGIHLATEPYSHWYQWGATIYEVEADLSGALKQSDKVCVRAARLLRPLDEPKWLRHARKFVESIPSTQFLRPDGNPNPEWRLFLGRSWDAARDAAWAAARAAAVEAAWAAAVEAAWAVQHTKLESMLKELAP